MPKHWLLPILLAGTVIAAISNRPALASADLDRQFGLTTVGFLRSWDNVDGLFADYVAAAYKDYFAHQSRFVLQDLSKADSILTQSKLPYYKVIEETEVLGQLARSTRSESIIRTKIRKEGAEYQFTMDWLHAPKIDLMASETFTLEDPRDGKAIAQGDIQGMMQKALDKMIRKVPFQGHVTGRDGNSVTVNIGSSAGLKVGDTLVISTLDDVKRHPLLKQIVDWQFSPTGRVVVDQTDEGIAFCKVLDEVEGRQISRFQKVTQIIPKPILEAPLVTDDKTPVADEPPRLGWAMGGLNVGSFNRSYSPSTGTAGKAGGGLYLGGQIDGQLWLTREIFVEGGLGYGFWGYGQTNTVDGSATPASGIGGTLFDFHAAAGYTYLVNGDVFGTKGWVKLGYRGRGYTLPNSDTELTGADGFYTLFIGLGGELPIRAQWGALMNLEFGALSSASSTGPSTAGTVTGGTDVRLYLGATYRYTSKMTFRLGFDIQANGANFTNASLSEKVIAIVPAVLYYF